MKQLYGLALLTLSLLLLGGCGGGGSLSFTSDNTGGDNTGGASGALSILVTDAPVDDLSSLQVDITFIDLLDTNGNPTSIFPVTGGPISQSVSLLDLQGVNALLANMTVPNGTYNSLEVTFENASALDLNGNALTISPSSSGTITVLLSPELTVNGGSTAVTLDFDLANSVTDVVPGAGGSMVWNPVIVANQATAGSRAIHRLIGRVLGVTADDMTIGLGRGHVHVDIDSLTAVEDAAGNLSTNVADLSAIVSVDDRVRVEGDFNTATRRINADRIAIRAGNTNTHDVRGVVTALGVDSFDVLVTSGRFQSLGLQLGAVASFTTDTATTYSYNDPASAALSSNLEVGQDVTVTADVNRYASAVEMEETTLVGSVLSLDTVNLQAEVDVTRVERIDATILTNFATTATMQYTGSLPVDLQVGSTAAFMGNFGISAAGIFDVNDQRIADPQKASFEGSTAAVVTASPLTFTLDGNGEGAAASLNQVTVGLDANATLLKIEDQNSNHSRRGHRHSRVSRITEAELESLISNSGFSLIFVRGEYDSVTGVLTAQSVRVDTRAGAQPHDPVRPASMDGDSYTVLSSSPLSFALSNGSVSLTVNVGSNTILAVKAAFTHRPQSISEADLAAGMTNGDYSEIYVKGLLNTSTDELSAVIIVAEDANRDEVDVANGHTIANIVASPVSFDLTLDFGELDANRSVAGQSVSVTLASGARLSSRGRFFGRPLTEAELVSTLQTANVDDVFIRGFYDSGNGTFEAHEVRVRVR